MRPAWVKQLRARIGVNPSRVHLEAFLRRAAGACPDGSRVLDAGAGDARYRELFDRHTYHAADMGHIGQVPYGRLQYVCDLCRVPVRDRSYDLVVCAQVIEHVADPDAMLAELRRILKPGGQLWLTAPFMHPEHLQPFDYYRYTQFGLRRMAEVAGFDVRSVEWLEGNSATAGFNLQLMRKSLQASPAAYGGGAPGVLTAAAVLLARPLMLALGVLLSHADLRHKVLDRGQCKNFALVAVRTLTPD